MAKAPKTIVQMRDIVRDAVYDAFKEAGAPLTREEVNKSVYIDKTHNPWVHPVTGTVVVNYEMGAIPSPAWNEVVDDILFDVSDYIADDLGKGFFIDHANAAVSVLVVPKNAPVKLRKGVVLKGDKVYRRRRKST